MGGHYVEPPLTRSSASAKASRTPFSQVPNPLATASLPSIALAQWMQPMISLGSRQILELDDMWPVCPSDACEALEQRFRRVYEPHRRQVFGLSPVFVAYLRTFQTQISTYVTKALLGFLNGEENVFQIESGYWLVAMMTGSSLVAVCALNYLFFVASRIGSNMRSLTMSLVYEKALKLSSAARQEYTTGEILTLMSVDTERVFTAMVQGPWLVMGPLAFVVSCVLIGFLFDFYAALAGAVVLTAVMVISVQQGDRIADLQRRLLQVIDERVKVTSEGLQGIRVMKFYAWEDSLAQRVEKLRVREVGLLRKFHSYQVINTVMLFITPTFLSGATLGTYVLIRHTITVVEAFTLVAMVNISRAALNQLPLAIGGLSKAKIAYSRIDAFLSSSEVATVPSSSGKAVQSTPTSKAPLLSAYTEEEKVAVGRGYISIRDGSFEWPANLNGGDVVVVTPAEEEDTRRESLEKPANSLRTSGHADQQSPLSSSKQGFQLQGVNIEIERGSLVMIVGKVGSGKSSLVNAILGEMPRTSGMLEISGRVAYVSQDTWIRNATLRDNILFEQEYDPELYARVLEASQLAMDLKALPNGDSTEIGERGINLSGGQKARVAIARAMYRSGTDVLLLDDPLSAVDPHVAHAIFDECVVKLATGQTRLLVLNSHYDLLARADHIVMVHDGAVAAQGSYNSVLAQFPHLATHGTSIEGDGKNSNDETSRVDEEGNDDVLQIASGDNQNTQTDQTEIAKAEVILEPEAKEDKAAGRLIRAEDRVKGKVGARVYKTYFDETGYNGLVVILVIVLAYCAGQAARTVVDWWPGHWARNMPRRGVDPSYSGTTFGMWYLGFLVLCTVLSFGRALMIIESCVRSSQNMHDELFRRVLRAPVTRYFDVTPMGQILNRFSNDLDQMDSILPQEYQLLLQNASLALGALIVSAFASYWIGVAYIPIFLIFLYIGQYFKKSSREIKRLEGVTRTPVYNLFSETLSGLDTIRAFRMEDNFTKQNRRVVDTNANLYLTYWAASRWLATRLDFLSVAIIFIVSLYLVATAGSVGSLTSGLSLTYSLMLTSMVQWVMRSVDRTDNAMTSVERLLHFRKIENEDSAGKTISELTPKDPQSPGGATLSWPSRGTIRFEGLCLRYRPELPLVLKGVDMDVAAGEKVGICGRTGAGKSSLMVALFRICDFDSGRVLIDDVDISSVNLRELRRSLAIIPQDPVLFSGPLRENLDPFHEYADERIWRVLQQVHMAESLRRWGAGLDFEVAEGGDNLSVGQRQLICVGRALLKDSKVVVLDEATANVDTATDALIQSTIQDTFQAKTVLIIAHRIHTIMHCDKIAVMDAGRVAEFGSPLELLARPQSVFAALAKRSGTV
ncbi:multidrug resistance protein ABC superfamily [Phytophthora sojae]|uniref:Multidrug resistance protein ABC superfamily n=1 Tax=Phytophthora sojae (strain P6497) TaxID=1094619 RepID=G4Z406_PHYSP|nr:multidrug resistance protein ABC superfamily [Phytophthora sojae]EGZ21558.1 multidrug resistance protein ABC superfamily [Phytophthora sojae]|eukprot:XP_009524275.1 multidrug resistance protein ABC superfamily [Phytophthora sojae]